MKVAVIGAGAAGLAAAYDLAGAGHSVEIFEAGAAVGGLAAGFTAPNWLWTPLLVGKFGEANLQVVNMAWLWARLHSRTTRLGTFRGGFQAFLNRFAAAVEARGVKIHLNCPVQRVTRGSGIQVATAGETK